MQLTFNQVTIMSRLCNNFKLHSSSYHKTDQVMNQKAFLQIVMPFRDKVFRLAKRLLVSQEEAEDATQDLYMKLWNNRIQLETYNNVEAYAMTITKNYCLDRLKSKQAGNLSLVHSNFSSSSHDLQQSLELQDSVKMVQDLINELPEQQKMVIQLRDIEQYEYEEIERILDMSQAAIRTNLSRARKTIREGLVQKHQYIAL
jgi:RNA polymerase sigma factor (sigma-70 family)